MKPDDTAQPDLSLRLTIFGVVAVALGCGLVALGLLYLALPGMLDGLDGEMGGSLTFDDSTTTERWQQVCTSEFEALRVAAQRGQRTLLDYYGATNLAEFFAVASETFFEKPRQLKHEHLELFDLLTDYYRVDPIKWT